MNMEALMEMIGDAGEKDDLTDVQIASRLSEFADHLREENVFEYGQVLIHKNPALATTKSARKPAIFMGYLAEKISGHKFADDTSDLSSNGAASIYDCRLMVYQNGSAPIYFADSSRFMPHPDFPEQSQ